MVVSDHDVTKAIGDIKTTPFEVVHGFSGSTPLRLISVGALSSHAASRARNVGVRPSTS